MTWIAKYCFGDVEVSVLISQELLKGVCYDLFYKLIMAEAVFRWQPRPPASSYDTPAVAERKKKKNTYKLLFKSL